jgi:CheY-like chemotaxis protein
MAQGICCVSNLARNMKVLVVDDVEAIGMIVSRIASQGGWACYYTSQTGEVLNILREKNIDILLCDYFMPEFNGMEILRMIRANHINIPVIFFTGNADEIDLAEAEKLGVIKILIKPLSVVELRTALFAAEKSVASSPAPSS